MLERKLFASFNTLQQGRYQTPQFKTGTTVSLVVHLFFFIAIYSVGIEPHLNREATASDEAGGGIPAGEIVEVYAGRLIMPPPEVIRQLLGEIKPGEPTRADFIAERSSVARGEANPNPRGSSQLPRSRGEGRELSSSDTSRVEDATRTREEPSPEKREREIVESRDRLPTVAPRPTPPRGDNQPTGNPSPGAGEGSEIAKLGSTTRELPTTIENQDSAVTVRGPISVNARGVGAIEEYRAYLERAIQQRWQIPPEANLLDKPVALTVEFVIAQDGRLLSLRLYNSTGIRALDRAALRAIELAAPFRPLPSIFTTPSQVFTDTFVYYPPASS
jgi:protein TonB